MTSKNQESVKKHVQPVRGDLFSVFCHDNTGNRVNIEVFDVERFKLYTDGDKFKCYIKFRSATKLLDPKELLKISKVQIVFSNNAGEAVYEYQFDITGLLLEGEGSYTSTEIFSYDVIFTVDLKTFETTKNNENAKTIGVASNTKDNSDSQSGTTQKNENK